MGKNSESNINYSGKILDKKNLPKPFLMEILRIHMETPRIGVKHRKKNVGSSIDKIKLFLNFSGKALTDP